MRTPGENPRGFGHGVIQRPKGRAGIQHGGQRRRTRQMLVGHGRAVDDEEPVSSTRVTLEVTLTIIFMSAFYMGQLCARQTTKNHKRVKLGQSLVSGSSTYPSEL